MAKMAKYEHPVLARSLDTCSESGMEMSLSRLLQAKNLSSVVNRKIDSKNTGLSIWQSTGRMLDAGQLMPCVVAAMKKARFRFDAERVGGAKCKCR